MNMDPEGDGITDKLPTPAPARDKLPVLTIDPVDPVGGGGFDFIDPTGP
jgi:hypothetical protein